MTITIKHDNGSINVDADTQDIGEILKALEIARLFVGRQLLSVWDAQEQIPTYEDVRVDEGNILEIN